MDKLAKSKLIETRKQQIRERLIKKRENSLKEKERSKSLYASRKNLHPPQASKKYLYKKLEASYEKKQKDIVDQKKERYKQLRDYFSQDAIKKHSKTEYLRLKLRA